MNMLKLLVLLITLLNAEKSYKRAKMNHHPSDEMDEHLFREVIVPKKQVPEAAKEIQYIENDHSDPYITKVNEYMNEWHQSHPNGLPLWNVTLNSTALKDIDDVLFPV